MMTGSFYPNRRSSEDNIMKDSQTNEFQQLGESNTSSTFVSKTGWLFLGRFIVEIFLVGAISALAYFLRFDDGSVFKPYYPLYHCESFSKFPNTSPVPNYYVDDSLFVYILFVAPLCSILLGETIRWVIGGVSSKTVFIWSFPIGQFPRRLIRFSGCFYFGFLLTSITADMFGFLINRPTPVFFANCLGNISNADICRDKWINVTQCTTSVDSNAFHEYFRSFPNYRSAVSAYAAAYMAWYFHAWLKYPGSYILCPIVTFGCAAMSLLASLSDFAMQKAHWEDVAVGLSLGIFIAVYEVSVINFFLEKRDDDGVKYPQVKNLTEQRASSSRTVTETIPSQEDSTSEPESHSSRYLPRIQAFNVGLNSKAKLFPGPLGDHYDEATDKTVQDSAYKANSSPMSNANYRQQQPNLHQLAINERIQQRTPPMPSPGYYNLAYDHKPIRAYDHQN